MSGVLGGTLAAEAVLLIVRSGLAVTVNEPALVVVPRELVMAIVPVVAVAGTVAVIEPSLLTTNVELTLLNRTRVEEKKLEPVMVTEVPTGPEAGVKPVIVGAEPGLTLVVTVTELFAEFGSPCVALTLPVALICPATVGETTMFAVRVENAFRSAQLQVTTPALCTQEPGALAAAELKVVAAGSVKVKTGLVAFELVAL